MDNQKCNGWSNYATWRIKLEVLDNIEEDIKENEQKWATVGEFSDYLSEYVDEAICGFDGSTEESSLAVDYARAFANEVNYYEIAESIVENLKTGYEYDPIEESND